MTSMTIAQASLALGVAQDTVRKRIRSGEIPATKERHAGGFRWMITALEGQESVTENEPENGKNNGSIPADFGNGVGSNNQAASPPAGETAGLKDDLVAMLKAQVLDLKESLEKRDRDLETRAREISELHQLLGARSLNPGVERHWWELWKR